MDKGYKTDTGRSDKSDIPDIKGIQDNPPKVGIMYCDCVWAEIDYRNTLLLAGCNPDCYCNECMDNRPYFPTHADCEA